MESSLYPIHVFRFHVEFMETPLGSNKSPKDIILCQGAFAECTGLEATMEPKVIKAGGHNYGAAQRAGTVTFSTVILKRGMTTSRDLWNWFDLVTAQHKYAHRLSVVITVHDHQNQPFLNYQLKNVLPTKFKGGDLNARGSEVGIEELHLAHEGLHISNT